MHKHPKYGVQQYISASFKISEFQVKEEGDLQARKFNITSHILWTLESADLLERLE